MPDTLHHAYSTPTERPLAAIALILFAFGIYTLQDTGIKFCSNHYPLAETLALLSVGAIAATLLFGGAGSFLKRRAWTRRDVLAGGTYLLFLYGFLGTVGSLAGFYVYTQMPLADAYAIAFARPLTVACLAHFLLGERLDAGVGIAIVVGFAGVILMLPLQSGGTLMGAAMAVFSMICSSVNVIVLRRAKGISAATLALSLYVALLASALVILSQNFQVPTLHDLAINLAAGMVGGLATLLTIRAFHMAPAAIVSPFHYSQLFWGILAGWLVFGTAPDGKLFLGAPLVIASGLFIALVKGRRLQRLLSTPAVPVGVPVAESGQGISG